MFNVNQSQSSAPLRMLQEKTIPENLTTDHQSILDDNRHKVLRFLNALKIISPIINAIVIHPGVESQKEKIAESFSFLISKTHEIALNFCQSMDVDLTNSRNQWIKNVVERNVSFILASQWVKNKEIDEEMVLNHFKEFSKHTERFKKGDFFPEIKDSVARMKIGLIEGMNPVLSEIYANPLYRSNIDSDIEEISQLLWNSVEQSIFDFVPEYASKDDRLQLSLMLLKEAGQLYSTIWKNEANFTETMLSNMKERSKDAAQRLKEKGGVSRDTIDQSFNELFLKMVHITNKLVDSKTIKTKKSP